jgi:hypothetical protein
MTMAGFDKAATSLMSSSGYALNLSRDVERRRLMYRALREE